MNNAAIWTVFIAAVWAASLWYSYSMGYLNGGTAANNKAAAYFDYHRN